MRYNELEQQAIDEAIKKLIDADKEGRLVRGKWWLCMAISCSFGALYAFAPPRIAAAVGCAFASFFVAFAIRPWRRD